MLLSLPLRLYQLVKLLIVHGVLNNVSGDCRLQLLMRCECVITSKHCQPWSAGRLSSLMSGEIITHLLMERNTERERELSRLSPHITHYISWPVYIILTYYLGVIASWLSLCPAGMRVVHRLVNLMDVEPSNQMMNRLVWYITLLTFCWNLQFWPAVKKYTFYMHFYGTMVV